MSTFKHFRDSETEIFVVDFEELFLYILDINLLPDI